MKIAVPFVLLFLGLAQFGYPRRYRAIMSNELLDYELDTSVMSTSIYFSLNNLNLEHVDDDTYTVGGYIECIKSLDQNSLLSQDVKTRYYQNSKWNDGVAQMTSPDACKEFIDPTRFYYPYTKLFTACPPKKGDKWIVENQTLSAVFDLPNIPIVPWRGYIKYSQGLPGYEKHLYGFGIQYEFIQI